MGELEAITLPGQIEAESGSSGVFVDQSVVAWEEENLTYDDNGQTRYLYRSRYDTYDQSAVAPVQLVSGPGHIYVFRQSSANASKVAPNTLLVDRFVLDGIANTLTPKLEVRFRRSREKLKPYSGKVSTATGLQEADSLDYKDANGQAFYEPTKELSLIDQLHDGWFSVVLTETEEHNVHRWHIFAFDSERDLVELTTLRMSEDGLFNVYDYALFTPDTQKASSLPTRIINGVSRLAIEPSVLLGYLSGAVSAGSVTNQLTLLQATDREIPANARLSIDDGAVVLHTAGFTAAGATTIEINGQDFAATDGASLTLDLTITNGLSAAIYAVQKEQYVANGQKVQLIKTAVRVMLSLATRSGMVSYSFAVGSDGMLSTLDGSDTESVLTSKQLAIILPVSNLDGIVAYADSSPPPVGEVTGLALGTEADDAEDLTKISSTDASGLQTGNLVQIATDSFDGLYEAEMIDANTLEIDLPPGLKTWEWEKVDTDSGGYVFDGMITAYERVEVDGQPKLRIVALNHGLSSGDKVQINGTEPLSGSFPVRKIDGNTIVIDRDWTAAEAINVNLVAAKRRGVVLNGIDQQIDIPAITLWETPSPFFASMLGLSSAVENEVIKESYSAWIFLRADTVPTKRQRIVARPGAWSEFFVKDGKLAISGKLVSGSVGVFIADVAVPSERWVHVAATLEYRLGSPNALTVRLYQDGEEVASGSGPVNLNPFQAKQTLTGSQVVAGAGLGTSLSINGNYAIAGAPQDKVDNHSLQGRAYIFERQGTDEWREIVALSATDGASDDRFGTSVFIKGSRALVGAQRANPTGSVARSGAAYLFERQENGAWQQMHKFVPNDPSIDDRYGFAVAFDGDTVVIGAFQASFSAGYRGKVYVYERRGDGEWAETKLTASDGQVNDYFGRAVAINGNTIVIGAPLVDSAGSDAGSVYIYNRESVTGNWREYQKLKATDAAAGDKFGYSVAIENDLIAIGAYESTELGVANSGSVYIFQRQAQGFYTQAAKVQSEEPFANAQFGISVALANGTLITGAPGDRSTSSVVGGAAYGFQRDEAGVWVQRTKVVASDPSAAGNFGRTVGCASGTLVIGAKDDDPNGINNAGSLCFFSSPNTSIFHLGEGLEGKLAEVRIWNIVRSAHDIKNEMFVPLTGKEPGLVGYWRLGGIVEGKPRRVTDFSVSNADGVVIGSAFVSVVTLLRDLVDGSNVVKYVNDDLLAVSGGASYLEQLEFRIITADGIPLDPNNVDGAGAQIFKLAYWGKANRNAKEVITEGFGLGANQIVAAAEPGWYIISRRVTIPSTVALMRTFEIDDVAGNWESLEVRCHTLSLVSNSVTAAERLAASPVAELVSNAGVLAEDYKEITRLESKESALLLELKALRELVKRLGSASQEENYVLASIDSTRLKIAVAEKELLAYQESIRVLEDRKTQEQANDYNYYLHLENRWRPGWWARLQSSSSVHEMLMADDVAKYHYNCQFKVVKYSGYYEVFCRSSDSWKVYGKISGSNDYLRGSYTSGASSRWKFENTGIGSWIVVSDYYDSNKTWNKSGTNEHQVILYRAQRDKTNTHFRWTRVAGNIECNNILRDIRTNIAKAEIGVEDRRRTIKQRQNELSILLKLPFDNTTQALAELTQQIADLEAQLNSLGITLYQINQQYTAELLNSSQVPLTMPVLNRDRGLETYGGLMSSVKSISRLEAKETCDGQVQVTNFDDAGRIRTTLYDAVADSRNTTFEQWLLDPLRFSVALVGNDSLIELDTPLALLDQWTFECWLYNPLLSYSPGESDPLVWNVLAESVEDTEENGLKGRQQIVVYQGNQLGLSINGFFHDFGISLNQLTYGWHHLAVAADETGAQCFLDGETGIGRNGRTDAFNALDIHGSEDSALVEFESNQGQSLNFEYGLTIELWAYVDRYGLSFFQLIDTTGKAYLEIRSPSGTADLELILDTGEAITPESASQGVTKSVKASDVVSLGRWCHIAAVIDPSGAVTLLSNGEPIAQGQVNIPNPSVTWASITLGANSWPQDTVLTARLSEVRVWTSTLLAEEIRTHLGRALTGEEASLLAYWRPEMAEGAGLADSSENGYNGRRQGRAEVSSVAARLQNIGVLGNTKDGGAQCSRLAEVHVWSDRLSADEVRVNALTLLSGREPGLAAYYPMREGDGQRIWNYVGDSAYNANLVSGLWWACTAKFGNPGHKVMPFDGTNDYLERAYTPALNPGTFTCSFWAYIEENSGSQWPLITNCDLEAGTGFSISVSVSGHLTIAMGDGAAMAALDAGIVPTYRWVHIALTADGSSVAVYVDGKQCFTGNATYIPNTTATLYVGCSFSNQDESFFQGNMAELRLWNTIRSEAEINTAMHRRLTGEEVGLTAYWPLDSTGLDRTLADMRPGKLDLAINEYASEQDVMVFNGADAYVAVPPLEIEVEVDLLTTKIIRQPLPEHLTVSVWAKSDTAVWNAYGCLISRRSAYMLHPYQGSTVLDFEVYIGGTWRKAQASLSGVDITQWHHYAGTYDGQTVRLFVDGVEVASVAATGSIAGDKDGYTFIGKDDSSASDRFFAGQLTEVRLWDRAHTAAEIQNTMTRRLVGTESGLVACWPLGRTYGSLSGTSIDLTGRNNAESKNTYFKREGDLPIGSILIADRPLPITTNSLPISADAVGYSEYSTIRVDSDSGVRSAMMRGFYCYPDRNGAFLFPERRIENLELLWIGNAQFQPTLQGYIEGAPPVPSENLTEETNYNGASSVELAASEDVTYSWNRTVDRGHSWDLGGFIGIDATGEHSFGTEKSPAFITAHGIKAFQVRVGLIGGYSEQNLVSNQSTISSSDSTYTSDRLELRGSPEQNAAIPQLGKRFLPKNVGYAVVVSALADVFVTRLSRSGIMVGYQVLPVPDTEPDINTITFLMNPTYVMNGSLDGQVGSSAADERFYAHVPAMRAQFGSLYPASYFRLAEAQALERAINNADKQRESYFAQFSVDAEELGDESLIELAEEANSPVITLGPKDQQSSESLEASFDDLEDDLKDSKANVKKKVEQIRAAFPDSSSRYVNALSKFSEWQEKMGNILVAAGKHNIVNSYVWDADGGMRAETQSFASTIEHSIGSSYSENWNVGADLRLGLFVAALEFNFMRTASMTRTITKTKSIGRGMSLNVDVSGVESVGVTDSEDYPLQPGEKVDRYRFKSFYLENSTQNYHDFFNDVVDPEWLQSNDEEARALRQVVAGKANKAWRVLHRVTYVERPTLMGFGRDTRKIAGQEQELVQTLTSRFDQLESELETKLEQILTAINDNKTS